MTEREKEARFNLKALKARNKLRTILIDECVDAYLENGARKVYIEPKEFIKDIVGVYF